MAGEVAIRNLYDAAITGDIRRFVELIEADPYLPLEASYACSRNILHIATMHGHAAIVEEVINRNPRLARDLDSERSSPLHTAAAGEHEEIAAALLRVSPATCWWRDCHGMNPVHIAAINGHVETLRELIAVDRFPAMERLHRGQKNVLHLCLKHGKFNAFIFLVDKLKDLVYVEDDDGETILHAAIRLRKVDVSPNYYFFNRACIYIHIIFRNPILTCLKSNTYTLSLPSILSIDNVMFLFLTIILI